MRLACWVTVSGRKVTFQTTKQSTLQFWIRPGRLNWQVIVPTATSPQLVEGKIVPGKACVVSRHYARRNINAFRLENAKCSAHLLVSPNHAEPKQTFHQKLPLSVYSDNLPDLRRGLSRPKMRWKVRAVRESLSREMTKCRCIYWDDLVASIIFSRRVRSKTRTKMWRLPEWLMCELDIISEERSLSLFLSLSLSLISLLHTRAHTHTRTRAHTHTSLTTVNSWIYITKCIIPHEIYSILSMNVVNSQGKRCDLCHTVK